MARESTTRGGDTSVAISRRVSSTRKRRGFAKVLGTLIALALPLLSWAAIARPQWLFPTQEQYSTLVVDRGDVNVFVVESGTLENADNAMVRCKVEALLGTVGGQGQGMGGMGGGGAGGGGMGGGRGGAGGRSSRGGGGAASGGAARSATPKSGAASKGAGGAAGSGGAGGGSMAGGGGASAGMQRPMVTSFSFAVPRHVPLRPMTAATQGSTINQAMQQSQQQQRGGMSGMDDRPGSTRILKILPEGTLVKADDLVCSLDSAAFRDELQAELITWSQAKSWVEQAETALEVAKIALEEYKLGVYPRDLELIDNYILTCELQQAQALITRDWTKEMVAKKLQSRAHLQAAELNLQRTNVAVAEAKGMRNQLVNFAGPKNIANLEANIAAVTSDLQAQKAAFTLEDQRKTRLEAAIANCELRAPRDGMVVYVNQANRWGQVDSPIQEGSTVRENQAIFQIPNSGLLKVRSKVNESKVSLLREGVPASIRVEALPDASLRGKVETVTVIPTTSGGPFSDVKVYYADVELSEGSHEGVRPGMTARVEFLVDTRRDVTRVPIDAIRWSQGNAYVAIPSTNGAPEWKQLSLGARDEYFAEVLDGLAQGDRIIARPDEVAVPLIPKPQIAAVAAAAGAPNAG